MSNFDGIYLEKQYGVQLAIKCHSVFMTIEITSMLISWSKNTREKHLVIGGSEPPFMTDIIQYNHINFVCLFFSSLPIRINCLPIL